VSDGPGRLLQVRVGTFILLGLGVFLAIIYLLGAQARYFERKYDLYAEFDEVGGLIEGATVRLAGVQIGRVTDVSLPPQPGGKVRVTLNIARRFSDRIRTDSEARIVTQGLLGDKLVEITIGSPSAPPMPAGAVIASREPFEPSRIFAEGAGAMVAVERLATSVSATLERLERQGAFEDLAATLRSARGAGERLNATLERVARLTEQVEKGRGWLHTLIYDEPETLRRLNALLEATRGLIARAEGGDNAVSVFLSPDSGRAARSLLEAMESVGRSARTVEASVDRLGRGVSANDTLLAALLFDPQYRSVADDLRTVARNFREVSEKLANGQGLLGELLDVPPEPGSLGRAASDLRAAMANLRAVSERLERGDGTLGALIEDPTVYEGLVRFLEGAERSTLLRALIRSTVRPGAPAPGASR
jgi:phospholipid/cholesterol/gamma-HCH transport system substrate-binding protein